ncbi:unnamed protein product [Urochloa humidicola]
MICFGQLAQCMIGKPVDQVIRTVRHDEESRPYVAGIVSQKYTFSVTVANQSLYTRHISFMVNSIIASYGRQRVIPHGGTSSSSRRSSYLRDGSTSGFERNSAISTSVRTPTTTVRRHTPPHSPATTETLAKDAPRDTVDTPESRTARKRLRSH